MQDINPQGFSNPVLSAATSGDVEAARQNVINAFADAAQFRSIRTSRCCFKLTHCLLRYSEILSPVEAVLLKALTLVKLH